MEQFIEDFLNRMQNIYLFFLLRREINNLKTFCLQDVSLSIGTELMDFEEEVTREDNSGFRFSGYKVSMRSRFKPLSLNETECLGGGYVVKKSRSGRSESSLKT